MRRKRSPKEVRNIMYKIRSGLLVFSVGLIIIFIYEFYLAEFNILELFSEKYRTICGMVGFYGLYYYQYKFTAKKIEESFNKNNNLKP